MIPLRALLLTLTCALFSAGIAIAGKFLTASIPSVSLTFLRISIASLCFVPFVKPKSFKHLKKSDIGVVLLAGSIGIFLSNLLYFVGINTSTALHASLINSLTPALMLMTTCLYMRRMPALIHIASFALALFGVFLIITEGNFGITTLLASTGNLLMLASVGCWVIYSMTVQQKSDSLPSIAFTFGALMVGTLFLLPLSMQHGLGTTVRSLSLAQWGLTLYIAVVGTGIGYFLYGKAVEQIGPDKTAFMIYSTAPVFVVILTYFFFDDPITSWEIAGALCILGSLVLYLSPQPPLSDAKQSI